MDDKIRIKLMIADTYYPLNINRSEEELIRKAAKQINDKLNKYRSHFPTIEPIKLMTMVALDLSKANLGMENKNDTSPFTEKLEQLTQELEDYIRKE